MPLDKLRAINAFIAISKEGSLTKAANQLGKSLPTIVRTLATLENDLGFRLFNRSTRNISLTEEGEQYLDYCSNLVRELSLLEERLGGQNEHAQGRVNITSPVLFGEKHVMPAILKLYQSNPKLNVRLLSSDALINLVKEQIDIAVRIGHLKDSSLISRQVGSVRRVLCASNECLEKYGKPNSIRELSDKPCIQFNGKDSGLLWLFQSGEDSVRIPVESTLLCNMVQSAIQACVSGIGFGIFLEYQVIDEINSGKLHVLLEQNEPKELPIHLVYPHAKLLPSRVKMVLDELSSIIQQRLKESKITPMDLNKKNAL